MMRPLDILLRFQGDLLKAMESEAMRWFARRQEDVQAGLHALERLSTSTDVETLVDVQRDWLRGAVERLQADLAALASRWTLPATTAPSRTETTPHPETQPPRHPPPDPPPP